MESKHIVIIGAGIAGLSAASYLLRNGYRVTIVEQHVLPGGLCTSWNRKGYTIDYCVHWLMGTREGTHLHAMWEELGAFVNSDGSKVPVVNFDVFDTVMLSDGTTVSLYSDIHKLKQELLRIGPEDERPIDALCKALKRLGSISNPEIANQDKTRKKVYSLITVISQIVTMMQHLIPMKDYVKRFKSKKLQELFLSTIPHTWSTIAFTMGLAQQPLKNAGYVVGGSLNFAQNIERVVKRSGGVIRYGTAVTKIRVQDTQAVGVELADSTVIDADYVISAADGYATVHTMLDGQIVPKSLKRIYEHYPLFPSTVMIALGLNRDCSDLPHGISLYLKNPITLFDGTVHDRLALNIYHYDPTLAPLGKTVMTVLLTTWESAVWEQLATDNPEHYAAEKERIAQQVIERLEAFFGNIASQIEMIDVSTPRSVMRYTGNWKGSFEGFAPTRQTVTKKIPKHIPGLENFAMIGQWTSPGGGLPTAAKDGRDIARELCKKDRKQFVSTL